MQIDELLKNLRDVGIICRCEYVEGVPYFSGYCRFRPLIVDGRVEKILGDERFIENSGILKFRPMYEILNFFKSFSFLIRPHPQFKTHSVEFSYDPEFCGDGTGVDDYPSRVFLHDVLNACEDYVIKKMNLVSGAENTTYV